MKIADVTIYIGQLEDEAALHGRMAFRALERYLTKGWLPDLEHYQQEYDAVLTMMWRIARTKEFCRHLDKGPNVANDPNEEISADLERQLLVIREMGVWVAGHAAPAGMHATPGLGGDLGACLTSQQRAACFDQLLPQRLNS